MFTFPKWEMSDAKCWFWSDHLLVKGDSLPHGSEGTNGCTGLSFCPLSPVESVSCLCLAARCFVLIEKCIVYFNADLWCFIHILNLLWPVVPMRFSLLLAFFSWLVLILYFAKGIGRLLPCWHDCKESGCCFPPHKSSIYSHLII